eukprot:Tamp_20309.p2 GENE.Tamp_20309~~Tamp_20309.p2  ORF type:complete len:165 (+),score=29.86 Tamp_20309:445-939(+)
MGAGMHMYSSGSSSDAVKRCGYASVAEWRAAAAEEWRLSADAKRMDLTFEEASATSASSNMDGDMWGWRIKELNAWRGAAALEWRYSSHSTWLNDSFEPSPILKWSKLGGLGAWREFAANRWRSSEHSRQLDEAFEDSDVFSLDTEPFSVSFFPDAISHAAPAW